MQMEESDNLTLFVGNLSEEVTEDLLYELFLQAGPVSSVKIPVQNGRKRPFGFVEFKHEISVDYATHLFYQTSLFGRILKLQSKKRCNRLMVNEETHHSLLNPFMYRSMPMVIPVERQPLPPIKHQPLPLIQHQLLPLIPPPSIHTSSLLQIKRIPAHLMPSAAKKKIHGEGNDKKHIPDAINYRGLISKDVSPKKKNRKNRRDNFRSKSEKKKKKKNGHSPIKKQSSSVEEKKAQGKANDPPKSYLKNAVNQIKQHCSRNNKGSYDLNSKDKLSRHIYFNT